MSDAQQMDAIEDWLTAATGRALHTWAAGALDTVLPSLTADGDDWVPAPDLSQLLATVTAWAATFHQEVLSPLLVLMAARAAGQTAAAGAVPAAAAAVPTIPADPDGLLRVELQALIGESAELRALVAELSGTTVRAAVPAMEAIVALPSWEAFTADYLTTVSNRVVGMPDDVFRHLTADLAKGVDAGESAHDLSIRVRNYLDTDTESGFEALATRATRIARTEATGAYNGASLQAAVIEQDILGIELQKVWVASMDGRTRDSHFAADGQRIEMDEQFTVGGAQLRYPGDPQGPAREVINCVIGSTHVGWPGQGVLHSTRREHRGAFVDLVTADGHELTVTPNHPVLTTAGYVPAGSLSPGDEVFGARASSSPEVSDTPPSIEQLHSALGKSGVAKRVIASGVDFHGDASEQDEVEVVGPDRDLSLNVVDSHVVGGPREVELVSLQGAPRGRTLLRGAVAPLGDDDVETRVLGAPARIVGRPSERPPLVAGQPLHSDLVGLRSGAGWEPEFIKPSDDDGSADAEFVRHVQNALACGMATTEIIQVKRYTGNHAVYNLSTTDEWYIANGIAVHNCRCTMLTVEADEPLPGETDRQTERERSDGTRRDPFAEVRRRAANEGVTRAREDPAGVGHVAAAANQEVPMPDETRRPWSGLLAPIGVPTGDGRIFAADIALAFREFPLPLMWQRSTDIGHDSSVIVGRIDTASIEDGQIIGAGVLFDSEDAVEAGQLLADEVIRPSVDLCDVEWALADADGQPISDADAEAAFERGEQLMECTTAATVMGATLVAKPAFADAKIVLEAETVAASGAGPDALVAAAAPWAGTSEFFADPKLDGPTPLTVTADGRVYGHLATWGVCHVGIRDSCITAPKTGTDYAYFHVSEIPSTGGPVAVGRLTVGTGHAGARDGVHAAAAHYDNTGSTWAYARAGEDAHGIWVAGQVHPHATAEQVAEGSAAPLSGDWRRVGGNLELVAALGVVSGGFPVPRGARNTAGAETSLVAAGALRPTARTAELSARAIGRAVLDEYLSDQRASQAAALAARARTHHARALTARVNGAK